MSEEVNFDCLIGPTHNFAGLSYGNIASMTNESAVSHPKKAALQGLEKMILLVRLGLKQAIFPPHERPHLSTLKNLGFTGSKKDIFSNAYKENRELFFACCSSSSMWAANAATVSPSIDSQDGKVHFTPANLMSNLHRSIETFTTKAVLEKIFSDPKHFIIHEPLPNVTIFADEGAANHLRFCKDFESEGLQVFVYGRSLKRLQQTNYPARHTLEASLAISRLHKLDKVLFAEQSSEAIDAGVFHNDVISTSHQNLFFYHEKAFTHTEQVIAEMKNQFPELIFIPVSERQVSLKDSVNTYLFNSQIVTLPCGNFHLIAPKECCENESVKNHITNHFPIKSVSYVDLKESMQNGGGPACLRLRVVLTENELSATLPSVFLTEELYLSLKKWIEKHYRDELHPEDLKDPKVYEESKIALDELTKILKLDSIYEFQK